MRPSFNKKESRKFLSSFQNSSIENREGLSSLIRTHARGSRARLHDLSPQDTEAISQRLQDVHSSDFTRKMAFLGSEQNYHAEASKGSSYHESLMEESGKSSGSGSGIHVKNEVEIRR